ncbi:8-oxo-dGTP diphosphatase MutT [Hydromonas duriensis]|uniref:8-oxo-dGTP diphosphatase n=1 Tax=Hydromonas duriensis TaxID=1527608 RepID=A0A4R6YAP4_9BURK|nr:8-oxo-dGTP diphosphatase MutT [Hydromonas duriensis]TDR32584.1 8-oxo-dGTPase [Hydromonas duriensis]
MSEPSHFDSTIDIAPKRLDVAVGVLRNTQGEFLFAQRPEGKPMAGFWEFPGGKVESGESIHAALARELHEELGIDIADSMRWLEVEHVYPHAHVLLHFRIISEWRGKPHGRENQALHWQKLYVNDDGTVSTPSTEPVLPATVPLLAQLAQWTPNH